MSDADILETRIALAKAALKAHWRLDAPMPPVDDDMRERNIAMAYAALETLAQMNPSDDWLAFLDHALSDVTDRMALRRSA